MFAAKNGALEISLELLEAGASLEHRDLVTYCTITHLKKVGIIHVFI